MLEYEGSGELLNDGGSADPLQRVLEAVPGQSVGSQPLLHFSDHEEVGRSRNQPIEKGF